MKVNFKVFKYEFPDCAWRQKKSKSNKTPFSVS